MGGCQRFSATFRIQLMLLIGGFVLRCKYADMQRFFGDTVGVSVIGCSFMWATLANTKL
jgi:hypothetical protein